MNENTRAAIKATFEASIEGQIHFGEVIGRLIAVQVESYHVDYRSGRTTYYLPDVATLDLGFELPREAIAEVFDGDGVRAAILGAQQGRLIDQGSVSLEGASLALDIMRLSDKPFLKAITMLDARKPRLSADTRADLPQVARQYPAALEYCGR